MLNRLSITLLSALSDLLTFSAITIVAFFVAPELCLPRSTYFIFFILYFVLAGLLGLYSVVVRDSWPHIVGASSIALVLSFLIVLFLITGPLHLEVSIASWFYFFIMNASAILLTLVGRVCFTFLGSKLFDKSLDLAGKKSVLIIGAGESASLLARGLQSSMVYSVKAFVTNDKKLVGGHKYSRPIISVDSLHAFPGLRDVDVIWLTKEHDFNSDFVKQVRGLVPLSSKVKIFSLEESLLKKDLDKKTFDLDSFLNLSTRSTFTDTKFDYIDEKTVLVTGAAGSIGSALVDQLLMSKAKRLVLLDMSEFGLYELKNNLMSVQDEKLASKYPMVTYILGSVQDTDLLARTFTEFDINIVIHAAAYKHVPIVEENLVSAFKNNVMGTYNLVSHSIDYKISKFILVSSDKAVRPTNFMGATKRIAELVVTSRSKSVKGSKEKIDTEFCAVRFGNVVGSSGSVLPKFISQIKDGGPVTVTDKRIERYFMSISEAASLVISAGQLSKGNEILLLDMGEPVHIYELARSLVRAMGEKIVENSGDEGIEIKIVGLRPGEKLYEELLIDDRAKKTSHGCIFSSAEPAMSWEDMEGALSKMKYLTVDQLLSAVKNLVPEFNHKP